PPAFLVEIARERLLEAKPVEMSLLRRAQDSHPNDFWVNAGLAAALYKSVFPTYVVRAAREEELPAIHKAIRFWTASLVLRHKSQWVHVNLGNALRAQQDLKGAIACFHKAIALDPGYAPAHNNLGSALQAQGDLKGAIASYHKALEIDPKSV